MIKVQIERFKDNLRAIFSKGYKSIKIIKFTIHMDFDLMRNLDIYNAFINLVSFLRFWQHQLKVLTCKRNILKGIHKIST